MTQGNFSSPGLASSLKVGESHQKLLSHSCFLTGPATAPRSSTMAQKATQQAAEGPQRVTVGLVCLWLNLSALPGTAAGLALSTANCCCGKEIWDSHFEGKSSLVTAIAPHWGLFFLKFSLAYINYM